MKLLQGLCIVALAIAFTIPAFAETQSIKLSGDLAIRYIGRDDYDFNSWDADVADTDGSYFMHNAEVQLDADLTDNVSVTIRLVNQTDWDVSALCGETSGGEHNDYDPNHITGQSGNLDGILDHYGEFDVLLDLGYITLKEFFFTPLTVRIGKQDIWFGKGFIVGANYDDPNGQISADEQTSFTSFKALRATWDFEPWTLDAVYAMIEENEVQADDDRDLMGLNLGCVLDYYNGEAEVYYWIVRDDEIPNMLGGATAEANSRGGQHDTSKENRIHCVGARGSFDPHEDITLWGEMAVQRGIYVADMSQMEPRDREAYAIDVGGEVRLWEEQYAWRPVIGAEYVFYSGQSAEKDFQGRDYHAWDRMFRGKVDSAIHEWYNVFYTTGMPTTVDNGGTNLHQFILTGSIQPMDNLTLDARYIKFRLHESGNIHGTNMADMGTGNKDVGGEVDLELTYEYTEDVTFGLLSAWFWSGDYYIAPEGSTRGPVPGAMVETTNKEKSVASEVVATCKVSF